MKITIHRGINQIGGCITEICTLIPFCEKNFNLSDKNCTRLAIKAINSIFCKVIHDKFHPRNECYGFCFCTTVCLQKDL